MSNNIIDLNKYKEERERKRRVQEAINYMYDLDLYIEFIISHDDEAPEIIIYGDNYDNWEN